MGFVTKQIFGFKLQTAQPNITNNGLATLLMTARAAYFHQRRVEHGQMGGKTNFLPCQFRYSFSSPLAAY
jgi:hypothetical protein